VSAGFERGARRAGVVGGRAGDIDEVGRFARQQQVEVFINPDILDCAQSGLAPRRNRFVNRDDFDVGPPAPSGQMPELGDLPEAGNCASQFQWL